MSSTIKNTADCPIEDLLFLIDQEHIEQLRSALLDTIDKSQPGGQIYLYEQGYSIYETKKNNFSPKLLDFRANGVSEPDKIIRFTDDDNFIGFTFLKTDDYVQVFTLESERSTRALLITVNKNIIDESYMDILLRVYNQQVYLLRNKDTDSLTGLYNRQSFDSSIRKHYDKLSFENRTTDDKNNTYLAMLDIDFFKRINDQHGHIYGDEVLLIFADAMKKTFRDNDVLFRYGGEEFAVLLKNVNETQADNILNRFRTNIENLHFPSNNKVTISIGFCAFTNNSHLTSIIDRADKALYYSKDHGRNQVSNFDLLLRENKIDDIGVSETDIELF